MSVTASLDAAYRIDNADEVYTPAVAVYPERIQANLQAAVAMAGGDPAIMRPHCKTHKTVELTRLELEAGITRHKCATIAEAEMLADAGVRDIVLAYPLVGPNIERFARLQARHPNCAFYPLADAAGPIERFSRAMTGAGQTAEILLDLDVGMGRTGVAPGADAARLYGQIARSPGLRVGGLHVYDGQNHQRDLADRQRGVDEVWALTRSFATELESSGLPVPRIVVGNSASYPLWAKLASADRRLECSPGTFFLNDWNYYQWFEDIPLRPAAVLLTRVVSHPRPGRLTLDLGYKAVASDSPLEARVKFLDLPDTRIVLQNEEHLVVECPDADRFAPGDLLHAWPAHICPTCALHKELLVVENNRVTGAWRVAARDRELTV